jgi:hypothetical protein
MTLPNVSCQVAKYTVSQRGKLVKKGKPLVGDGPKKKGTAASRMADIYFEIEEPEEDKNENEEEE